MAKSLHRMTKAELISTIQDYQEMVFEIEGLLNADVPKSSLAINIRQVMEKYLHGPTPIEENPAV
jgi:hypothetical protein